MAACDWGVATWRGAPPSGGGADRGEREDRFGGGRGPEAGGGDGAFQAAATRADVVHTIFTMAAHAPPAGMLHAPRQVRGWRLVG